MKTIIVASETESFENTSHGYLAFPFNEEQFKSFITGLLGKPQTISRPIYGLFEIYLKDIQNVHALLDQRVSQQNAAKLVQFKSNIYFSDGSSILLGSYDELITYNEIRPITTVAIQLSWVYLIKFSDKDVPEKQEIVISIKPGLSQKKQKIETFKAKIEKEQEFLNSSITYDISYTARTWGFDIDKLLSDHLTSILLNPRPINAWFNKYSDQIGNFILVLFLGGGLYSLFSVESVANKKNTESLERLIKTGNVDEKINFIINKISDTDISWLPSLAYFFIIIIFSVIVGVKVSELCSLRPHSYIILTREDVKSLPEKKKNEGIKYIDLIVYFLAAIILEWIGAFTFNYFMN